MPIHRNVNKDFFKKWTPEMAYVLGFFAADGYITKKGNTGYLCFEIADKLLLESIRDTLESDHTIGVRKPKNRKHSTSYRIQIGSKEMCDDLEKLGFKQGKTFNLKLPNVPEECFGDFVRGYFEGDGNVWTGLNHKSQAIPNHAILVGFTSGCREFLENLHRSLQKKGIMGGSLSKKLRGFNLKYSINDSLKIYKIMYDRQHGTLFLPRKKEVFERFFFGK